MRHNGTTAFLSAMSHTLKNVVIDNYFFGVAAVSKEGYETPVVFPGPAGSFGE